MELGMGTVYKTNPPSFLEKGYNYQNDILDF